MKGKFPKGSNLRRLGRRGLRYYAYFKRGHSTYLATVIGIGSTVGIWYSLIGFKQFFVSLIEFAMTFIPTYGVICILLGWQDYKRGMYQREVEIQKAMNPVVIEMLDTLRDISARLQRLEEMLDK